MLTATELKRLMELMSKSADKLSEAEKTELNTLKAKADAAQNPLSENGKEMTEEDLKKVVSEAVKAAGSGVTEAQVKTIVADAVKGLGGEKVDTKALAESITNSVKEAIKPGVAADDVKNIVAEALKNVRTNSKMQFEDEHSGIELPIAHRSGNLSVAQKQLLNIMTGKAENADIPESVLRTAQQKSERAEKMLFSTIGGKALTTTGAGTGLDWMNVTLSSQLMQRLYLESKLAAAMISSEVQMPTNPFKYPIGTTRPTFRLTGENTTAAGSQQGTGGLTLDAKKLVGIVDYSYEADEDSIIAILPNTLQNLGQAAAEALEDAILNGDTAATHQDSDSHALGATHSGKMFDGVRKLTLATSDLKVSLATGGITTANIGILKKAMKRWGLDPRNVIIVAGVNGYNDLVLLPETLTAEKVGNMNTARILTGIAPNLLGMDIIPSSQVRENLNATGVYDGTTTTKGSIFLIHKPSWILGVRRDFTVETDVDKKAQTRSVIASFRRDFKPMESLANIKAAVLGYNFNA